MAAEASTINIKEKNSIDKDVKSMLLPIHCMQSILLNRKYSIRHNFIYPNGLIYKCILFLWLLTLQALKIYRVFEIICDKIVADNSTLTTFFVLYIDTVITCIAYTINFVINAFKSKEYVLFVLKFQKVHRLMNNGPKVSNVRNIWICCILMFVDHVIYRSIYVAVLGMQWHVAINSFVLTCNDFNIIFAIVLIKLLTEKVVQWNVQVTQRDGFNEIQCETLFKAYVKILECFEIYKSCFQLPVRFWLNLQYFVTIAHFYFHLQQWILLRCCCWVQNCCSILWCTTKL